MDISSFERTISRYAPAETARPQGQPVAGTTADQTVTEAGFYKFFSYTTGYYYIVSDSAISSFPQYNTGNYIIGGHQYCYYLKPGDHYRVNSTNVLVQRFA